MGMRYSYFELERCGFRFGGFLAFEGWAVEGEPGDGVGEGKMNRGNVARLYGRETRMELLYHVYLMYDLYPDLCFARGDVL